VGLFLGCIGRVAEGAELHDAVRVLNAFGFTVVVPGGQTCCGAVHLHGGDPGGALARARRNLAAFGGGGLDAVVGCASGCTATLAEYHRLPGLGADGERAGAFADRVEDISAFLDRVGPPEDLVLGPVAGHVRVHDPCSLVNVLRAGEAPYRLLARVPGLEVDPLPGNDACCGSAGTYMLEHPETAAALVAPKVAATVSTGARWVATSNVGCALHLRASLHDRPVAVVHPVSLLARALEAAPPGATDRGG
jgi:glycolate oxidase iron-sulfur subunit